MKILVNAITSLGSFKGFMEYNGELTHEEAVELVDTLGQNINSLDRLTVRHEDSTETIFNKTVLANAIVQFKIED